MFTFPVAHHKKAGGSPSVASLVHWVSADVGVTKDGYNIVSAWADQSGNGTNWGTPAGGNITWVANQINGLPVLRSAGGTGAGAAYLSQTGFMPTSNTNAPAEVFVVLKTAAGIDPAYAWAGFSTEPNSSHYPFGGLIYENFGSTSRQNASQPTLSAPRGSGDPVHFYNIYNISNGASAGNYVMRLGGTQFYTGGPFNSGWATTFRLFTINVSAGSPSYGLNGDIAEILIYNAVLDSTHRATTYSYLQTKYGL